MSRKRRQNKRDDLSQKAKSKGKRIVKISNKKFNTKEGTYNGIQYESYTECMFLHWAFELKEQGFINRIERSPSFLLCNPVSHSYVEQLKRGSKTITQTIQQGVSYTPDFFIIFTEKAISKLIWVIGSNTKWERDQLVCQKTENNGLYSCYLEVKPDFNASTTPKSVMAMKWLYQSNSGIFVNLFKPYDRFEKTFVPKDSLYTSRGIERKLKFKALTLKQYLDGNKGVSRN